MNSILQWGLCFLGFTGILWPHPNATVRTAAPAAQRSVGQELDVWVGKTEELVVPTADAMPEEKYSFAPSPSLGEFKAVRTFAQQVKHFSATNYILAARVLGEKPPHDEVNETAPESIRTKAEIM